jgi:hypothetical protein
MLLIRILVFLCGLSVVAYIVTSAIRTFVVPRNTRDKINTFVFLTMRSIFDFFMRFARTYERRDSIMAFYAPFSLFVLPAVWLCSVFIGYMGMYWAINQQAGYSTFKLSGSALFTLGFALDDNLFTIFLIFSEAAIGLLLIALLIAYLPTIYTAFSKRETAVTLLEVRAGSPPSAVELLVRYFRIKHLDELGQLWDSWEQWFVELEESHTSLAVLSFFRSPKPDRSWITAAGTVLDSAALTVAVLDIPHNPQADLCIRAGFLALRYIASYFKIPFNPNPAPNDPISISREEFDTALAELEEVGLPLKADREQAWRDFAGWRVNYDTVLLAMADLLMAPPAHWVLAEKSSLRRNNRGIWWKRVG